MNSLRPSISVSPTDLDALEREVLARGPEAALPQNLSDTWLQVLVRDLLDGMFDQERVGGICAGPMLLVGTLADAQAGASNTTRPEPRLIECFARYRTALMEELLGRQTGIFRREYSITDIFK
ncbi:hypothetical protein X986_6143 [Burkholderia pseudomallei]|nr:hypothetical protein X990_6013 [Burkholderia pseudomallei MSHR4868]KGX23961.1 hypothetical protein X984_6139 [Burkholderia pseudomallei]KGX30058.1 hypothetical protein X986_6143 [Burkholderia pseudomallei]